MEDCLLPLPLPVAAENLMHKWSPAYNGVTRPKVFLNSKLAP